MSKKTPNKGRQLFHVAHRSKGLLLLFSFLVSLLVIVVSTYAWQTYSDEKLNRVEKRADDFNVVINEVFETNMNFQPGVQQPKAVTVENYGKSPVVVRVSFYEFFLAFEQDYSDGEGQGNGNLKRSPTGSEQVLRTDTATWVAGDTYKFTDQTYLTGTDPYQGKIGDITTAYHYKGSANHKAFTYLELVFNTSKVFEALPSSQTNYWLYHEGYFYYSEVLSQGEETPELLKQVNLSDQLPNRYELALYQLVPYMEAHEILKSTISDWDLIGTPVETMYQGKLN